MYMISFKDGVTIGVKENNIKVISGSLNDVSFNTAISTGNTGAIALNLNERLDGAFNEMDLIISL